MAEPGDGSGDRNDEGTPPIWEDVTERQPERDVPPTPESFPIPPPAPPGAERPAPPQPAEPAPQQPQAGQPAAPQFVQPGASAWPAAQAEADAYAAAHPQQPSTSPQQPVPGGPIFVNPEAAARQAAGAPTFLKPDGTPAGTGPTMNTMGQGGRVQPGGPVFIAPGTGLPVGSPSPQIPGGPVFVQPGHEPAPVDHERPWRWWVGPIALTIAIFGIVPLQLALAAMIAAVEGGGGIDVIEDYAHWFGVLQDVCWVGIVVLVPYLIVKHLRPDQLGIRMAPVGRSIGIAAAAVFSFYLFAAVYSSALGLQETDNTMLQDTGFGDSILKDVIFALLFTVAAPVAEELLFRSLLFRTIRDGLTSKWGPRGGLAGGAIISGVIFGGIHLGGGQDDFLPVLMLLGIVLALAYHWSGTIYVPIVIHSINNALATGFNSDPAADWIYVLIFGGPLIAFGTTYLIGKWISRTFRPEPPNRAQPPAAQPASL